MDSENKVMMGIECLDSGYLCNIQTTDSRGIFRVERIAVSSLKEVHALLDNAMED